MTISLNAHNPKDYRLAIKVEATLGSALITGMQEVNVDSIVLPEFNYVLLHDRRQGVGRTAKTLDVFECKKGVRKVVQFDGIADSTVLPLLMQNAITVLIDGVEYKVPYNYTQPADLGHGETGSAIKTLTLAIISPETNGSTILKGGCITKLSLKAGGIGEENSRVKFSATYETQYI